MKYRSSRPEVARTLAVLAGASLLVTVASAEVTTISYYRLGEDDSGAAAGQPVAQSTVDGGKGTAKNLFVTGTGPAYSAGTGVNGSTLCLATAGGGYTNGAAFAPGAGWGIEAWVKASNAAPVLSTDGYATIVFNGDSAKNGMGIVQTPSGNFAGLVANVAIVGGAAVEPGTWTHLALVTAGGTTTFYVNGTEAGTGGAPNGPSGFFGVGVNFPAYGGGEPFEGSIDEVRIFSFAPGEFSTDDLLLTSVPPQLATPPKILSGPTASPGTTLLAGGPLLLSVGAAGTAPLSYYWHRGVEVVASGTNASLSFSEVTTNMSGDYSVIVSNSLGSVTSSVVAVTILPAGSSALSGVAYYRLGENDPGAVSGNAVENPTVDVVDSANLGITGASPTYSASTGVKGSTLGVVFNGGGFITNAAFPLVDNWGVEAWVKANGTTPTLSTDGYATIVVNGDTAHNGMAIVQTPSGRFVGLCANVALVGGANVVPGAWTHLALVTTQGTTTFYVNGEATGTGGAPLAPNSFFGIGYNPGEYGSGEPFEGSIDEVRVFSVVPGQFNVNDLLIAAAPPGALAASIISGPAVEPGAFVVQGTTASLKVVAGGTSPLGYQWRKDGVVVPGLVAGTLSLTNVTVADSGQYDVVVTNLYGSITSSVASLTVLPAQSYAFTTVAHYRLGEEDPGAVDGQAAGNTTVDTLKGFSLEVAGTPPSYSSAGGVTGSTRSMAMAGGGYIYNAPFALSDNWGIEAWVKADGTTPTLSSDGHATVVFNGDSNASGMGILQTPGGKFVGLCAGVAFVGGAPVVPGVWTHLAIVNAGRTVTFYVNGVSTGTANAPALPTAYFGVGFNPGGYGGGEPFEGSIDEVRVFTFTPGLFSTNGLMLAGLPLTTTRILPQGDEVVVFWDGKSLQQAVGANGPWTTVTNASVPMLFPASGTTRFFRAVHN